MKYIYGIIAAIGASIAMMFQIEKYRKKAQQAEVKAVTAEAKAQDTIDTKEVTSAIQTATTSEDKARADLAALNDPSLPKL
jgi:uncharacterized membrane protein